MFQLKGRIKEIKETRQVSEKFSVREFVVVDESTQYPQFIQFQATQDRCDLLDNIAEGEEVAVNFNLRGREWTNAEGEVKYFNSLDAWKIESMEAKQTAYDAIPPAPSAEPSENDDDLPF